MDGFQGAILRVKLRHLETWNEARRAHAALYNSLLAETELGVPVAMPYGRHVYHVYAPRVPKRNAVQQAMQAKGIQTNIHYPIPVHLQEAHADLGYRLGDFPCSELVANEVLSLPMYAELSDENIEIVTAALREAVAAQ